MFWRSRVSTICSTSFPPPLAEPRIVPPFSWMSSTTSGVRSIIGHGEFSKRPRYPNGIPVILLTPYLYQKHLTTLLITLLSPGQMPPQVQMAAWTWAGLKYIFFLGPASSRTSSWSFDSSASSWSMLRYILSVSST